MKEITNRSEIAGIGRAVSSEVRLEILDLLKKNPHTSLTELYNKLKHKWAFITIQNHCRVLAEEGIIEMKRREGRYTIKLKKIPKIYVEEIE